MPNGTGQFDAVALDDHARLAQAIDASGVAIDRMLMATYDADGVLQTARFEIEGRPVPTSCSIGIVLCPRDGGSTAAMAYAEAAARFAKRNGGATFAFYEPVSAPEVGGLS